METSLFHPSLSLSPSISSRWKLSYPVMILNCMDASAVRRIKQRTCVRVRCCDVFGRIIKRLSWAQAECSCPPLCSSPSFHLCISDQWQVKSSAHPASLARRLPAPPLLSQAPSIDKLTTDRHALDAGKMKSSHKLTQWETRVSWQR